MDTEKQAPSYQEALLYKTQHQHQQQQSYVVHIEQQQPHVVHIEQQQPHVVYIQQQRHPLSRCLSFTYLFVFFSLFFLLLSLVFKFKAVSYINLAINSGCSYSCIQTCYNDIGQKINGCIQQGCDICDTVGMQDASRYTLLFIVFLTIGGVFIFIQLFSMCCSYMCLDYYRSSSSSSSSNSINTNNNK